MANNGARAFSFGEWTHLYKCFILKWSFWVEKQFDYNSKFKHFKSPCISRKDVPDFSKNLKNQKIESKMLKIWFSAGKNIFAPHFSLRYSFCMKKESLIFFAIKKLRSSERCTGLLIESKTDRLQVFSLN